jgi:hypothetical protein
MSGGSSIFIVLVEGPMRPPDLGGLRFDRALSKRCPAVGGRLRPLLGCLGGGGTSFLTIALLVDTELFINIRFFFGDPLYSI